MEIALWIIGALYVAGFLFTFWVHVVALGNVTLPLVLLRCVLWPLWVTTGRPEGGHF